MFLHYLNNDQKQALFQLATRMIQADQIVAPAEICYRDLLVYEAGITPSPVAADSGDLLALFPDRQSCTALVVELLVLAIVDGTFHPEEAAFSQSVIDYFGFSPADQDKLNRMAEQIASSITGFWDLVQLPDG